ncbi:eukaryotic rRNA processing, partial [Chytridium lagenaria]
MQAYLDMKKEERLLERLLVREEKKRRKTEEGGDNDDDEDDDDEEDDDEDEDDDQGDENAKKVYVNDKSGLLSRLSDITLSTPTTPLPWLDYQSITSTTPITLSKTQVDNDLTRELAFYKQALEAAVEGEKKLKKLNVPVFRPLDYYAEMVKSDEHMMRVRQKLVDEANAVAEAERIKKMREAKKFGKKVQQEKLAAREQSKKKDL